jgi:large subunit ribosomal protein L21e
MANRKKIRTRGKLQLSRYFQEFDKGDKVAVVKEASIASSFPKILQGKTGIVEGRKGKTYILKIMDGKKEKSFLIEPIHLKKIK